MQLNSNNLLIFILFISSQRNMFKIVWPKYMKVIFKDVGFFKVKYHWSKWQFVMNICWWKWKDRIHTRTSNANIFPCLTIFTVFVFDCSLRFAFVSTKSNCLGLISKKLNVDKEIVFLLLELPQNCWHFWIVNRKLHIFKFDGA